MTNKGGKILKYIIIILIIVGIVWAAKQIALRVIYPKKYEEQVTKYATENNLDPLFVFAVIKAESNFNPNVVSPSKAIGLMQLLEPTAKEVAEKKRRKLSFCCRLI